MKKLTSVVVLTVLSAIGGHPNAAQQVRPIVVVAHGPTLPPDPWDGLVAHGPTLPPDPWDGAKSRLA
jgi:hypothetical protein